MKFTRLEVHSFRGIEAFSSDIGDGIVLFKGPNEAGKSSLLSALLFALFEDPKSSAQRVEGAKKWNKETLYRLVVTLSGSGQTYALEKDFENRSILLRNETTRESWKDKNKVNVKLTQILGFSSRELFTSTACVFQDELHAIRSGQKELRELLEEKVAGKGDAGVETIVKSLERKILELKRGLDRPAPVNPGQIRQADDELKNLVRRRDEIAEQVSKLHKARERRHGLSKELHDLKKELDAKRTAWEKSGQYVKARERHKDLHSRLEGILESLERLSKAEQDIEKLQEEHEAKKKKLKDSETALAKGRAASKLQAEKAALALEADKKKQLLGKAMKIDEAIAQLKKSLNGVPLISGRGVQELFQAESDIRALERGIGQRAMHMTVAFKAETPYAIKTEDGVLSSGRGGAGETIEGSAKKEILVDFEDVAEVRIATRDQALEENLKALKQKKDFLAARLREFQCQSSAELAALKEKRDKNERELRAKENERKMVLGNETRESLSIRLGEIQTESKHLDKSLEDVKAFVLSEEALGGAERKVETLRKEVQAIDGNMRESQGILKAYSKEQLEKEKKGLARDIVVAETALNDLKGFEASGEEVIRQENEVKRLEQKLSELKVEQQALEHLLKEERYGQEDVAELEERIESLERRVGRFRTRLKAYEVIREVLAEARRNILKGISGHVDERIGAYLGLITDGRYNQVQLSRKDFSLQVFSPEKRDWIDPESDELSTGTKDQLYLAARLALVDVVCKENAVPVILDDPLVHFDALRRENTRNLFRKVSGLHQVLIFSCHDYYDEWADQIISF